MRCPSCNREHGTRSSALYVPTRAGYLALATWRAEAARKQTEGALSRLPSQVPAPSSDVTRAGWGDSTSMDVASARVPNTRAVVE